MNYYSQSPAEVSCGLPRCCSSSRMRYILIRTGGLSFKCISLPMPAPLIMDIKLAHPVSPYSLFYKCICTYMPQGMLSYAPPNIILCSEAFA